MSQSLSISVYVSLFVSLLSFHCLTLVCFFFTGTNMDSDKQNGADAADGRKTTTYSRVGSAGFSLPRARKKLMRHLHDV